MKALLLFCCFAFLACACGCVRLEPKGNPTRYFVLSPPSSHGNRESGPALALVRVDLPDYLQKPSLAVRQGENEIIYVDEFHWAEPIDRGIRRVFSDEFQGLSHEPIRIDLAVRRFEVDVNGEVVLEAEWNVSPSGGLRQSSVRRTGPKPGQDITAAVQTLSEAVLALADGIAKAVAQNPEK